MTRWQDAVLKIVNSKWWFLLKWTWRWWSLKQASSCLKELATRFTVVVLTQISITQLPQSNQSCSHHQVDDDFIHSLSAKLFGREYDHWWHFFEQQYVKVKSSWRREIVCQPIWYSSQREVHLVSVVPVLYRAKYTHFVVVPCTVVFTLWKDYAHRVGTLWTHCGGHKEGLYAQSHWHLTTIKMRNWGGRRNGFNRTLWISTHHLYKYA